MQWWIGLGSPGLEGIGLPGGLDAVIAESGRNGVQARVVFVQVPSTFSSSLRGGSSMTLIVPRIKLAMYCSVLRPGCGPRGFAVAFVPFTFAINSCFASGVKRTEVGYQPVGIKPSDRVFPG